VDPALSELPVVLLGADSRMEEKVRILEADGAIRKPIDLPQLLATIERFRSRNAPPVADAGR
jgi:DNA-binding response OmpR family regulator